MRLFYVRSFLSILLFFSMLPGCINTYQNGEVLSRKLIKTEETSHPVRTGATIGGASGAIVGAGFGTMTGLLLVAIGHGPISIIGGSAVSTSTIVGMGVTGGVIGGIAFGVIGSGIGSGLGLAYYGLTKNHHLYEYQVRSLSDNHVITIQQTVKIPSSSKVRIFERNGSKFIRLSPVH